MFSQTVKLVVIVCLLDGILARGHHKHHQHHHAKKTDQKPTKKFDIVPNPESTPKTEIEAQLKVLMKGLDGMNGEDGQLGQKGPPGPPGTPGPQGPPGNEGVCTKEMCENTKLKELVERLEMLEIFVKSQDPQSAAPEKPETPGVEVIPGGGQEPPEPSPGQETPGIKVSNSGNPTAAPPSTTKCPPNHPTCTTGPIYVTMTVPGVTPCTPPTVCPPMHISAPVNLPQTAQQQSPVYSESPPVSNPVYSPSASSVTYPPYLSNAGLNVQGTMTVETLPHAQNQPAMKKSKISHDFLKEKISHHKHHITKHGRHHRKHHHHRHHDHHHGLRRHGNKTTESKSQ